MEPKSKPVYETPNWEGLRSDLEADRAADNVAVSKGLQHMSPVMRARGVEAPPFSWPDAAEKQVTGSSDALPGGIHEVTAEPTPAAPPETSRTVEQPAAIPNRQTGGPTLRLT